MDVSLDSPSVNETYFVAGKERGMISNRENQNSNHSRPPSMRDPLRNPQFLGVPCFQLRSMNMFNLMRFAIMSLCYDKSVIGLVAR